jgi:AbrB family looped-hinge helix DNA binding protein
MRKLVVDAEGRITIPPDIVAKRGLRPGDELTVVEAAEGLLLYQRGSDPVTARWWSGLSEDERRQARAEAERYESLSEEERDRIWNEGAEGEESNLHSE